MYAEGRYIETIRRTLPFRAMELRRVQEAFVESLPPAEVEAGFRGRLAAALLHADAVGQAGAGRFLTWRREEYHLDARRSRGDVRRRRPPRNPYYALIRGPLEGLPDRWPASAASLRDQVFGFWGRGLAREPMAAFRRELVLAAARLRFARMDLSAASSLLEQDEGDGDPALLWQLAAVRTVRARLLREESLWGKVREGLREASSRSERSAAALRASARLGAAALGDPDDRNLRLALAAVGMGREDRAAARLREVSAGPSPRLRVPKLLIEAELQLARGRTGPALAGLREAAGLSPDSQAVVAGLVVALQRAGRREEAAALASDLLGAGDRSLPWMSFLLTWAERGEPGLEWLRTVVASG